MSYASLIHLRKRSTNVALSGGVQGKKRQEKREMWLACGSTKARWRIACTTTNDG